MNESTNRAGVPEDISAAKTRLERYIHDARRSFPAATIVVALLIFLGVLSLGPWMRLLLCLTFLIPAFAVLHLPAQLRQARAAIELLAGPDGAADGDTAAELQAVYRQTRSRVRAWTWLYLAVAAASCYPTLGPAVMALFG